MRRIKLLIEGSEFGTFFKNMTCELVIEICGFDLFSVDYALKALVIFGIIDLTERKIHVQGESR